MTAPTAGLVEVEVFVRFSVVLVRFMRVHTSKIILTERNPRYPDMISKKSHEVACSLFAAL